MNKESMYLDMIDFSVSSGYTQISLSFVFYLLKF